MLGLTLLLPGFFWRGCCSLALALSEASRIKSLSFVMSSVVAMCQISVLVAAMYQVFVLKYSHSGSHANHGCVRAGGGEDAALVGPLFSFARCQLDGLPGLWPHFGTIHYLKDVTCVHLATYSVCQHDHAHMQHH